MSAIAIAGVVFACVFGSALFGLLLALQISRDLLGTRWLRIAEQSGPAAIRSDGGFLAQHSLRHVWCLRTDAILARRPDGLRENIADQNLEFRVRVSSRSENPMPILLPLQFLVDSYPPKRVEA